MSLRPCSNALLIPLLAPVLVPVLLLGLAAAPLHADTPTPLTTKLVVSGLVRPVLVTAPVSDPDRLFIVEIIGRIKILKDGVLLPTYFLNLQGTVQSSPPFQGVFGMAFHPDYANNGYFYVYYADMAGAATVVRYQVSADPEVADPTSATPILTIPALGDGHEGGTLAFGPDGYLYLATGDAGLQNDPNCNGQAMARLYSKMLRIDVDGGSPYAIPVDNPFVGDPIVPPETWSTGFRNPWRFSFDRLTGDLWLADAGQDTAEELMFEPAGFGGGLNYGWPVMEGSACFNLNLCPPTVPACGAPVFTPPFLEYGHDVGCGIIGGYVYRGAAIPDLRGTYVFGDYCSTPVGPAIFTCKNVGGVVTDFTDRAAELTPDTSTVDFICSLGEDAAGELYIVDHYDGEVFKLIPDPAAGSFTNIGASGIGGSLGEPVMSGYGDLAPGSPTGYTVTCTGAQPFVQGFLFYGVQNNPTPFYGGTFYPIPWLRSLIFGFDANGTFSASVALPASLPNGLDIVQQFFFVDATAPFGVSGSNALMLSVP